MKQIFAHLMRPMLKDQHPRRSQHFYIHIQITGQALLTFTKLLCNTTDNKIIKISQQSKHEN